MNEQIEKDIKRINSISGSKPVKQTSEKNPIDEENFPKIIGDLHKHGIDVGKIISQKEPVPSNPNQENLISTLPEIKKEPTEESVGVSFHEGKDDTFPYCGDTRRTTINKADDGEGYIVTIENLETPGDSEESFYVHEDDIDDYRQLR